MNFKTSYIYDLVDKISPSLQKINGNLKKTTNQVGKTATRSAALFRKFNNSLKPVKKNIDKLRKSFKSFNSEIGTKLSATFAAFTFFSLRGFNKQAQALEAVKVGLESTNGTAKLTFDTLRKEAIRLQKETLFGDEEILTGATAQLLTFTNIAGNEFLRTQQTILDVASRLSLASGGAVDLTSTAIQLGKALNDPVANLGALGRSGIQFSKEQKEIIKGFAETNQLAKAQRLILDELDKQYGGTAKALARVGTGPIKQLANAFGDLTEQIGKEQFKIITPLIKSLKKMAERFDNLSPAIKKAIAIFSLIAITVAPLVATLGLLAIAVKALIIPIGSMGAVLAVLTGPIGVTIAAVGLLLAVSKDLRTSFIELFTQIFEVGKKVFDFLTNGFNSVTDSIANFLEKFNFFDIDGIFSKGRDLDKILAQQKKELAFKVERSQSVDIGGMLGININAPSGSSANFTPSTNSPINTSVNFTQANPLF